MKFLSIFVIVALTLNLAFASPARLPSDDAEVIDVPKHAVPKKWQKDAAGDDEFYPNFRGVIDTGAGPVYGDVYPRGILFNLGFIDSFEDMLRRLRTSLLPRSFFGLDDDSQSESDEFPAHIDPKKVNTTSRVKVIDGHKVEVNETVYGDNNSLFKVRMINVRPLKEGEHVDETEDESSKNPATSGPDTEGNNNLPAKHNDDSSERREPLEDKISQNEVNGDIDGSEVTK